MGGQFSNRNTFRTLNDEDAHLVLGPQLVDKLANYAFLNERSIIVVDGNVDIDISLERYCRTIRKRLKTDCSSFVFTGNLMVRGRLEFNEFEIIVLGNTSCIDFIETSYNYFFGSTVVVKRCAIFSRTSGCVLIKSLQAPVIIASDNYPVIESVTGSSIVFSEDPDAAFIHSESDVVVHSPHDVQYLNSDLIEKFSLEDEVEDGDSANLVEAIYCQREAFLNFLDTVSSIANEDQ